MCVRHRSHRFGVPWLRSCVAEGMGEPLATEVLQTAAASGEQALVLVRKQSP